MVGIPIISFVGGTVSSASPYTLSNPIVGDMYNLTVAVRNAAGVATRTNLIKGIYNIIYSLIVAHVL